MFEMDVLGIKNHIKESGLKQKTISEKAGIPEGKLCLILNGKRKCEAGEYVGLCDALGVNTRKFMKPRLSDETKN